MTMRLAITVATFLISAVLLLAQDTSRNFAVASIHLTQPHSLADLQRGIGLTSITGYGTNKFTARNASLELLISIAFNKDNTEITGKPDWLSNQYYDLLAEADTDQPLTADQMKPLLRRLLETRFHLKTHTETVQVKGYALLVAQRVAPGTPNLKPSTQPKPYAQILPDGMQATGAPMKSLASMLRRPTGKPVVDETGLTGAYDFKLSYAPTDSIDSPLPSIFTALQEQLGLKLQPKKITVEHLVIDHVDKIPEEN